MMASRNGEGSPARSFNAMSQGLHVVPGGKDERAALHDLYQRYGSQILARCVYLLRDRHEAEDAMQDVYAKALNHLSEFRAEASPLTWLLRIATHHCLNVIRGNQALWHEEVQRIAQVRPVGEGGVHHLEGRELVRTLLAGFDQETQMVAVHYYVDEMTLEEVANAIGRSVPTVRKRLAAFAETARQEMARREAEMGSARSEESHG
jgi:RNA polymerase sigma factor (sigma-70 family)